MIMIFYIIYAVVNVITDIKYRITKNYWHLFFLLFGICYASSVRSIQEIILAVLFSLFIGLLLEQVKVFSAGDTKMIVVTTVWLSSLAPISILHLLMTIILFYLLPFVLVCIIVQVKKYGLSNAIQREFQQFKMLCLHGIRTFSEQDSIVNNVPGAIFVYFSACINYLIFVK
jgi:Flp pilus assembly protein protease CpaA